jgi:hypothetical protein
MSRRWSRRAGGVVAGVGGVAPHPTLRPRSMESQLLNQPVQAAPCLVMGQGHRGRRCCCGCCEQVCACWWCGRKKWGSNPRCRACAERNSRPRRGTAPLLPKKGLQKGGQGGVRPYPGSLAASRGLSRYGGLRSGLGGTGMASKHAVHTPHTHMQHRAHDGARVSNNIQRHTHTPARATHKPHRQRTHAQSTHRSHMPTHTM